MKWKFVILPGVLVVIGGLTFLDFDGDGLSNAREVFQYKTHFWSADTDDDGISDYAEIVYRLDPFSKADATLDFDSDELDNQSEILLGTDPYAADSDYDGLSDLSELIETKTNPLASDTDDDGLSDYLEIKILKTDPFYADSDLDGLDDGIEYEIGSNPLVVDSDRDLISDQIEYAAGRNPTQFDAVDMDTDKDGLIDLQEVIYQSDLANADSDGDGKSDYAEVQQGSSPIDAGDRGQAPPPGSTVKVTLTVGDHSGSHSERYNLIVGPIVHQAPEYGKVASGEYILQTGRLYTVSVVHTGSTLDSPDYDYTAHIQSSHPQLKINDPQGLLGVHSDTSTSAKSASMIIEDEENQKAPRTSS